MRNVVKWQRKRKEDEEGQEEEEKDELTSKQPEYSSRILRCTRCMAGIETRWMQLHTKEGFRGIHCAACKKQDRCLFNLCQCDMIWHQCPLHSIDPMTHSTTKGATVIKQIVKKIGEKKSSRRQAPMTIIPNAGSSVKMGRKRKTLATKT